MPTFSTLRRDADEFVAHTRFAEALRGQTILITGATGLIGATLVRSIKPTRSTCAFCYP